MHRKRNRPRVVNGAADKNARRCKRRALHISQIGLNRSGPRLRVLEIGGGLLAALGHHVEADLLALDQRAHSGALERTDMHEHVARAVGRSDEAKTFLGIEELYGTCGHHGLLALYALSDPSARPSRRRQTSEFLGRLVSTQSRGVSKTDRKPVASCAPRPCERRADTWRVSPIWGLSPGCAMQDANERSADRTFCRLSSGLLRPPRVLANAPPARFFALRAAGAPFFPFSFPAKRGMERRETPGCCATAPLGG